MCIYIYIYIRRGNAEWLLCMVRILHAQVIPGRETSGGVALSAGDSPLKGKSRRGLNPELARLSLCELGARMTRARRAVLFLGEVSRTHASLDRCRRRGTNLNKTMCVYMCIYIYIYTHVYVYIYIYKERERAREREMYIIIIMIMVLIILIIMIYIYIYIYYGRQSDLSTADARLRLKIAARPSHRGGLCKRGLCAMATGIVEIPSCPKNFGRCVRKDLTFDAKWVQSPAAHRRASGA